MKIVKKKITVLIDGSYAISLIFAINDADVPPKNDQFSLSCQLTMTQHLTSKAKHMASLLNLYLGMLE